MVGSTKIGSPFLEGFYNGYKLLIMNLVVKLWAVKLFREEGNWVK